MLDVAGNNLNTQTIHIHLRLLLHLITEGLTIVTQLLQTDRTDNLTHITLQRIHQCFHNLRFLHIQEILHGKLHTFFIRTDLNFRNCINVNTDEIQCRNIIVRLDIDTDLLDQQFILPLEERKLLACFTNQNLRCLS